MKSQVDEIFTINLIQDIKFYRVFTIGELWHHKIDERWHANPQTLIWEQNKSDKSNGNS